MGIRSRSTSALIIMHLTHYLMEEKHLMNADQFKGKWMQFKGELKEK